MMIFLKFMAKDRGTVLKKSIFLIFYVSLIITVLTGCGGSSDPSNVTGSASLSWNVPTKYVDGTSSTSQVGFKVYYGTESRLYTQVIDVKTDTSCTVDLLPLGKTYYFAITAYDSSGIESDYSNEIVQPL